MSKKNWSQAFTKNENRGEISWYNSAINQGIMYQPGIHSNLREKLLHHIAFTNWSYTI